MLTNCPECGTTVSDQAKECPSCAYPLNKEKKEPTEGCFLQTLNFGCALIAIIIGLIILVALFN